MHRRDTLGAVTRTLLTILFLTGILGLDPPEPGRAYEEAPIDRPGRIEGRVRYPGDPPPPTFHSVSKNAEVCGEKLPDRSLLVSPSSGLANVVVELRGVRRGKPQPSRTAMLDNVGCAFVPRVQVLSVGQAVEIRNSDPILHDAHAWLGSRTIFNLGLPEWRRVEHTFAEPGVHKIDCNVLHTWMKAWIIVVDHPYVAVTDDEGRFAIDHVPPGTYELAAWHERLGARAIPLRVAPDGLASLELALGPRDEPAQMPGRQVQPLR